MSFLQDHSTRRFFAALAAACGGFLLLAVLLTFFHADAVRSALLERETTLAAALLDRGASPTDIAEIFQQEQASDAAQALLARMGRTDRTPTWLLSTVRTSTGHFLLAAVCGVLLPGTLLLALTARYLAARDRLCQEAAAFMLHYADGDFSQHLPRAQAGALFRLFAAAEQLAAALKAGIDAERHTKEFLKDTVSDISHQLKTPLAAVKMYAEIIADEPGNLETVCTFAEKSLTSISRMEGLIGALLKMMRLDAGSITFSQETVRAADLAARASAELQTRAAHEGKHLTFSGDPALTLQCDPAWTAEAIGNLIKNALDHTRRGDTVSVCWEPSPAMLRITVSDTGAGIAPEDLHHIFKRFYRSPAAKDSQGVGLGLPLARAVIEGQGGLLTVQSEPGQGTVFAASFLTKV